MTSSGLWMTGVLLALSLTAESSIVQAGVVVDDKPLYTPGDIAEVQEPYLTKDQRGNVYYTWSDKMVINGQWAAHFQRYDVLGNPNSPHIERGTRTDSVRTTGASRIAVESGGRVAIAYSYNHWRTHPPQPFVAYVQLLDSSWQELSDTLRISQHANPLVETNGLAFDSSGGLALLLDIRGLDVLVKTDSNGTRFGDSIHLETPWEDDSWDVIPCWSGTELHDCYAGGEADMERLPNGDLVAGWWGQGFVGEDITTGYSFVRVFSPDFVPRDYKRIVNCDGYPCFVSPWVPCLDDTLQRIGGAPPFVEAFPNSYFIVAYQQAVDFYPAPKLPCARVFRPDGTPVTPPLIASDACTEEPIVYTKAAAADDGTFVIMWTDWRYLGWGRNLWVQRFDTLGHAIGVNHVINSVPMSLRGNYLFFDGVVIDSLFHIAWVDVRDSTHGYLYMQAMTLDCIGRYIPGDVDVNGDITSSDIIRIVNYVFKSGQYPEPQPSAACVNGDCIVNSSDIIYLVNYVFKAGPAPISDCLHGPS